MLKEIQKLSVEALEAVLREHIHARQVDIKFGPGEEDDYYAEYEFTPGMVETISAGEIDAMMGGDGYYCRSLKKFVFVDRDKPVLEISVLQNSGGVMEGVYHPSDVSVNAEAIDFCTTDAEELDTAAAAEAAAERGCKEGRLHYTNIG